MAGSSEDRVLHLIRDPDDEHAAFLVRPATLEAAKSATCHEEEEPPYDFGDLRRTGDLDELERQIGWDNPLEAYVESIERTARRQPAPGDLAARLSALTDVEYGGETVETDDEIYEFPSDRQQLNHDGEDADAEPYWRVIYDAMRDEDDIPADLKNLHIRDREGGSPAWWGRLHTSVIPGHLDDLITALEDRGYTVLRDDES